MSTAISRAAKTNQSELGSMPRKIFNHELGELLNIFNRLPFMVSYKLTHRMFEVLRLAQHLKTLLGFGGRAVDLQEDNITLLNGLENYAVGALTT
jgi:hypothetical protein